MRHVVFALMFLGSVVCGAEKLDIADGARVVFLGNTFFERDVKYGQIETALTLAYKDKNLTFRNLGWSGDTVWGHARAGFGSVQDGYNNMIKQVQDAKPAYLFTCFGMSESFEGEAGVAPFIAQYTKLLDDVSNTQAKIVIVTPIRHENVGGAYPDPTAHNKQLELYVNALKQLAEQRKAFFVDLFNWHMENQPRLTENGIHLKEGGYVIYGQAIANRVAAKEQAPDLSRQIHEKAIKPTDPVGVLNDAIVEKNVLFFRRWRPQNDTYIFGFRKHEQGRNAVDIPKFDPLIEAKEKEIVELKKAVK